MNKDFPRIITFLRKERGITQKQAAADLEISQAVLSHYEKGVRECGLDFLVKAAEYYEVSTDYLLGRTVQRVPSSVSDLPDSDEFRHLKGNMVNQINRRLLTNTTTIIYDLLTQMGSKRLTNTVSNYLMSAEYMAFRMIYRTRQPPPCSSTQSTPPRCWSRSSSPFPSRPTCSPVTLKKARPRCSTSSSSRKET